MQGKKRKNTEKTPAKGELRKEISAVPSDIFPDGKVIYFLAEM